MKLQLQFFDEEEWSIYGFLNCFPGYILLLLFKLLTPARFIIASIIGMLSGDLLARIMFIGFLLFMIYQRNKESIISSVILIIATIISFYIPYKHKLHMLIYNSPVLMWIMRILIFIGMSYLVYYILLGDNNGK